MLGNSEFLAGEKEKSIHQNIEQLFIPYKTRNHIDIYILLRFQIRN